MNYSITQKELIKQLKNAEIPSDYRIMISDINYKRYCINKNKTTVDWDNRIVYLQLEEEK